MDDGISFADLAKTIATELNILQDEYKENKIATNYLVNIRPDTDDYYLAKNTCFISQYESLLKMEGHLQWFNSMYGNENTMKRLEVIQTKLQSEYRSKLAIILIEHDKMVSECKQIAKQNGIDEEDFVVQFKFSNDK